MMILSCDTFIRSPLNVFLLTSDLAGMGDPAPDGPPTMNVMARVKSMISGASPPHEQQDACHEQLERVRLDVRPHA
jgi:hypothetical protein